MKILGGFGFVFIKFTMNIVEGGGPKGGTKGGFGIHVVVQGAQGGSSVERDRMVA